MCEGNVGKLSTRHMMLLLSFYKRCDGERCKKYHVGRAENDGMICLNPRKELREH